MGSGRRWYKEKMAMEGEFTLGGEHIMQHIDNVL